jgi:dTDP-4-dehydrorhamnose 3,5-epimerase
MRLIPTDLTDITIIEPKVFGDARGYFVETWSQVRYRDAGLPATFVQDNVSRSSHGVLRGLHFQNPKAQGKLVTVLEGEVYDVAVDIRIGSPTFGRAVGVVLSGDNKRQVYVPPGFAHGFCVTSETALFMYKCTELYAPEAEKGITWNDPDLGIRWPIERPTLSSKDANYPRLRDIDQSTLPTYQEGGTET